MGNNGHSFASKDVVLVTINYRLGIESFLFTENGAANVGLQDQIMALRWVKENIEAFGGDASKITVFGESAGAMSIGTLLAIPEARRYFDKAILASGAASHAITID